jgi:hypothetical protein
MIIADNEKMIRNSTIKLLCQIAEKYKLQLNIFEVEDGVETLFMVYKCVKNGINIDFILSDENMVYYTGTLSSFSINQILKRVNLKPVKF